MAQLIQDALRPGYHFLPPANWMNDPNGLIEWQGQYHMFYQYNPNGPFHGTIHWGHATSKDLVHWEHQPIALAPTPGGPDAEGCWSGCAVVHEGLPTLIYSGPDPVVCLATSMDNLQSWQKYEGNPVITGPPATLAGRMEGHFRNPYVWREEGYWYMIIGSKLQGIGGAILLYRSTNLIQWEYLHPLLTAEIMPPDPLWPTTAWECPNLIDLGDKHALVLSVHSSTTPLYALYFMGSYEKQRFTPETHGILVHGCSFYAPLIRPDGRGRYLCWGWLREGRSPRATQQAGWAGVMSLPLTVTLRQNNRLSVEPVSELTGLRRKRWQYERLELSPHSHVSLHEARGDCLEIIAEVEPGEDAEFGLLLRCSLDGQEQSRIVYQHSRREITLERTQSSLSAEVDREPRSVPVELLPGEPLRLHLFLDRSVIELFVNRRTTLASRIYPTRPDSLDIGLLGRRGSTLIRSLEIWSLEGDNQ